MFENLNAHENKYFNILVVEDNIGIIEALCYILQESNYIVSVATNGKQAIEILRRADNFNLVLLDINMPVMNGYETCKVIREDDKLKDIPIIFLTALSDSDSIIKGFEVGVQDYITKPFNSRELLARVETHLQLKDRTDQLKIANQSLHDINKEITDSINYAKIIQQALFPPVELLARNIPDHFIFYKPKDIVSGDFYWFKKVDNLFYIVAADCTGHGVPGAFMSMLGISMLNEITSNQEPFSANLILNELRNRIKSSLQQFEINSEINDGMDISMCILDLNTKIIQYSGAYNPLYLIRFDNDQNKYLLIETRADNMPVGKYPIDDQSFTNHVISLKQNDSIYIFSDGYISQFGGETGEKFKKRRFQQILLEIQDKRMADQKEILEKTLLSWQGKQKQVDDILVIGIKINVQQFENVDDINAL